MLKLKALSDPFVRTDRPDPSRRNDSKLSSQTGSQIVNSMHEGERFSVKTLGESRFHFQTVTDWSSHGLPASSGKWKAPLVMLTDRV